MPTTRSLPLAVVCVLISFGLLVACTSPPLVGSTERPVAAAPQPVARAPQPAPSGPPPVVAGQIRNGSQIYARSCAQCHGSAGEGSQRGPALVGPTAMPTNPRATARVRRGQFRSAMDIGMFIKGNMPPVGAKPPMTDIAAVLAWLLQSNGVTPRQQVGPSTAGSIPWSR